MMSYKMLIGGVAALGLVAFAGGASAQDNGVASYEADGAYADVRQDVEDAIINRGFVIDYNAKIGDMLSRTKEDVGSEKKIFANAETLQFCSAVLSRKAMEADPNNIAYCPYAVFVYEAPEGGKVMVGYRKLGSGDASLEEINALLDEIAKEAAGQ